MTLIDQNFNMFSGDTKNITVIVEDELGAPLDITGATIKWAAKKNIKSSTNSIFKTVGVGITITSPLEGKFVIKLDPEDTDRLSGEYYQEAEIKDIQNNVSTILTGKITIEMDGV